MFLKWLVTECSLTCNIFIISRIFTCACDTFSAFWYDIYLINASNIYLIDTRVEKTHVLTYDRHPTTLVNTKVEKHISLVRERAEARLESLTYSVLLQLWLVLKSCMTVRCISQYFACNTLQQKVQVSWYSPYVKLLGIVSIAQTFKVLVCELMVELLRLL